MVLSFANLAAPTATAFPSLGEAVARAQQTVPAAEADRVRRLTKVQRREYLKQSSSNWPCLSLTEGVNPTLRISSDNPPQLLHGFAADYDSVGRQFYIADLAELASRCAYPPAAAGPSLSGEGVHAIWLFKEPIPVLGDADYARKVLSVCYSKLRVGNYMQGFDEGFKKPDRLLSIDHHNFGWTTALGEAQLVDEVSTRMWAASVTKDFRFEGPQLDIKLVYEQVQKLFPGRWVGEFVIGARGCRFWDSSATDHSAAVVTSSGMVYFSDGGGFKPWSGILGTDVAAKLSAQSLGELTDKWYYDCTNKVYVWSNPAQSIEYHVKNRTQLCDRLQLAGLQDEMEVKRSIVYIEDHKGVTGVVSLANQKRGLIRQGSQTYINSTDTVAVKPSNGGEPVFINTLLETMFEGNQLHYFLGWLQDSLRCVMEELPSYAQAVFMAGDVQCGKSLLQYHVLTPLFGGRSADPMPALLGESSFNSELSAAGHWMVSDQEGAKGQAQRSIFTQRIKAIAANPGWSIHAKYKEPVTLMLNSRITFSFNGQDECLSVVPRLGHDILDKIILLSVSRHDFFKGMDKRKIEATVAQELPWFAHWLLNDYRAPDEVLSTGRYRTKSYHHPDLMHHAKACQDASELLGWLNVLFMESEALKKEYFDTGKAADFTAARWLQLITQICGHHFGITPNRLSSHFQNLSRQYPDAIKVSLSESHKLYSFSVDYKKLTESK